MRRIKWNVLGYTFLIFIFLSSLFLNVQIYRLDKNSEKNTTELQATVTDVKHVFTDETVSFQIVTDEYKTAWNVNPKIPNLQDIENKLEEGGKIFFRIQKEQKKNIDKKEKINVVSLRTEDEELFSIADYNQCMKQTRQEITFVGILESLISGGILILCLFRRKAKKARKSHRSEAV